MAKVADQIAARRDEIRTLTAFDRDTLYAKLREIVRTENWDGLSDRQLRHVPACLWVGDPRLASNIRFLNGYFRALRKLRSRLATKALVWSYLLHFEPGAPEIIGIGRYLSGEVRHWKWEWAQRHDRIELFDAERGPKMLAAEALGSDEPRQILVSAGLRGPLASSGFAVACFREAADKVRQHLQRTPTVDFVKRIVNWAVDADGRMKLSSGRRYLAEALLLPWQNGDPPDELRQYIRSVLLTALNDPRIAHGEWVGVCDEATGIMVRWLARASLEQFLAVVDHTALEHQWEFRRAFWGAYIDRNHVRDAWVVFASTGRARANQLARENDDPGILSFGSLRGGSSDQAVLLLRIGELIVADWSHNGTLRIWRTENQQAPKFYAGEYQATALRHASDFDQRHMGDWQRYARDFIARHTGIRIKEHEYMPRGRRR
jgi:hypothetical protein